MESKGQKYHLCPFCGFKSVKKQRLESHIQFHTRERPFYCDQCKRGFSSKQFLSFHKLRVHEGIKEVSEKKYKCSLCTYATCAIGSLKVHIQTHNEERSFSCHHTDCQYVGKLSQYLDRHITRVHKHKRNFVCQFPNCGYRGKARLDIRTHSVSHSEDRPFVCDFEGCSYRAKLKGALRCHIIEVHHGGQKPFTCSACNYCTASKGSLRVHELTHSEERPVKCSFSGCAYSCKLKKDLSKHVLNCHTERTFKCDFAGCSSTASRQSILKKHKKSAHGEKIYKCPSCDYFTANQRNLQRHTVGHEARRMLPCPRKGCTFVTKNPRSLYQHIKYHKVCPVEGCSHVSQSSSSLKSHMKLHDPTGRPFDCPLCSQYFPTGNQLSSHLRKHTQEKPFKCPECNYAAIKKHTIKTHVRIVHPTVFFKIDDESICDHCSVNFGSAVRLAFHEIKLKTAVVVLPRLQLKFRC